ncbi:hypothetical protein [Buttiauxella sp. S19-1]|uniref:hypothetical protein n=1 Tax=Buttiauxella sp. S19-1 TaxID=941430 RepID=UPI001EDAE56B|nr:hypothetical protein [Buttiauxella sp. S19-1]
MTSTPQLEYAVRRIVELENLLHVDVPEKTVWPQEAMMVLSEVPLSGELSPASKEKLLYHVNRMWLERLPLPSIVSAANALAAALSNRK